MTQAEEKQAFRSSVRRASGAMSAEEKHWQSQAVCKKLCSMDVFLSSNTVLFYMPLADECDISEAVRFHTRRGGLALFPKCVGDNRLELYLPCEKDALIKGRYGIMEPDPEMSRRMDFYEVDCAIVPGVAFDIECNRLGRGAGYYDRLLASADVYTVGVAFDCGIVERVPHGEKDMPVDCVISNKWIFCK